jgi:hypothetical protein
MIRLTFMKTILTGLLLAIALTTLTHATEQSVTDHQVYVMGNVVRPTALPLKESMTLTRAISAAGGALKDAKYDNVLVYRSFGTDQTKTCVSLTQIRKHRAPDLQLQPNDILDVIRGDCSHPLCWEILPKIDRFRGRVIQ